MLNNEQYVQLTGFQLANKFHIIVDFMFYNDFKKNEIRYNNKNWYICIYKDIGYIIFKYKMSL